MLEKSRQSFPTFKDPKPPRNIFSSNSNIRSRRWSSMIFVTDVPQGNPRLGSFWFLEEVPPRCGRRSGAADTFSGYVLSLFNFTTGHFLIKPFRVSFASSRFCRSSFSRFPLGVSPAMSASMCSASQKNDHRVRCRFWEWTGQDSVSPVQIPKTIGRLTGSFLMEGVFGADFFLDAFLGDVEEEFSLSLPSLSTCFSCNN